MRVSRPGHGGPDRAGSRDLAELVAAAADDGIGVLERRRRLATLAGALVGGTRRAGLRALSSGQWLADTATELAPRIPVRDRDALRKHHPGRSDDEVAERLARSASIATAAVGAAAGVLAAVEFAAPPLLLAAPALLTAETLAVIAIEVKLVAELHEITNTPVRGGTGVRAAAYLTSWSRQRAVDPLMATNLGGVLGQAAKRELRTQLARRFRRSVTSLAPLLAGAVAGSEVNRRATRALGDTLCAELRGDGAS